MNFNALRKQGRWSRRALAEKLNLDQSTIAKWERGESSPRPYWDTIVKLSEVMETDPMVIVKALEEHQHRKGVHHE